MMKRILFLLLMCLFLLIPPAIAQEDAYNFNVSNDTNILELNSTYNGTYVQSINGTLTSYVGDYLHRIPITLNSTTALNNATVKLEIQYNNFMKNDFSDLNFVYPNGTEIQYYVDSKVNGSNATIFLKMDLGESNTIYMDFDSPTQTNQSNITEMFLYTLVNESGQTVSTNTTFFSSSYTDAEVSFRSNAGGAQSQNFYFNNSGIVRISRATTSTGLYVSTSSVSFIANNSTINYAMVSTSKANASIWDGANPTDIKTISNSSMVTDTFRFSTTASSSFAVFFKILIYNSTNYTYTYGPVENLNTTPISENVSIGIPPGIFKNLTYGAPFAGNLNLILNYTPHIIPITENGTSFDYGRADLLYISNPSDFQTTYQIAKDVNFNQIVISGNTTGGNLSITDVRLSGGVYYWRIQNGDNSWTETRTFDIDDRITLTGHVTDGITGEFITKNTTFSAEIIATNTTAYSVNSSQINGYINGSSVIFSQGSITKTLNFDNVNASFVIEDIQLDVPFTLTIQSTNTLSYANTSYQITIPSESPKYELNFSTFRNITPISTSIYGIVTDQYGTPVNNGQVIFSYVNGTILNTATIQPGGEYGLSNVTGEYFLSYQADGFSTKEGTVIGSTRQDIMLDRLFNITITATDSRTGEAINTFSTYFGDNQSLRSTDNGTVIYRNVEGGRQQLIVQAQGYNQITREIYIDENTTEFNVILTKSETDYYEPHVAQFSIREESTGLPLYGVSVKVYAIEDLVGNQTTGDDGTVTFQLTKSTQYRIVVEDESRDIYKEVTITPANYLYVIYVSTSRSNETIDYNYNRYIAFTEIMPIYNETAIRSMGYNTTDTPVVLVYSVFNNKNDGPLNETTTITLIYPNGTEIPVTPDSKVIDGSTIHYYLHLDNSTDYPKGSVFKFYTIASHLNALDGPVEYTKEWKISLSPIRDGFNIFPGFEYYYNYLAILILFLVIAAIVSYSTVEITVFIAFIGALFFAWIGWLTLTLSAGVFLILAFIIFIFKKAYRGSD